MLLKHTLIVGIVFACLAGFAQYEPMSTLSMFNQMYYNPGYAGDGNDVEAKLLNRNQWMNFVSEGTPNTQYLNVDAPFKLFNHQHGAGLSIISDQLGFQNNVGLNLSYAYRKNLVQGSLGIGAGLNMTSYGLTPTWITGDVADTQDPSIPDKTTSQPLSLDMNLGVFYRSDNLYFGASIRNLLGTKVKWKSQNNTNPTLVARHVYLSTGYDYQLPNPMFAVQPNVFVSSDFSVTQVNLTGKVTYNNRFFGDVGYRPGGSAWVLGGIDLPSGIEVAVSYDVQTSRLIKSTSGSFEFMLGYSFDLDIDKDTRKYKSVRFL